MRTRALVAAVAAVVTLTGCASASDLPTTVGATAPIAPSVQGGTPVPAVIGRHVSEARRVLEEAGFRVNEVEQRDCLLVDRAEATAPAPGTPIAAGSTVTLTYSGVPPGASCAYNPEEHAWDFLEWADGRGSPFRLFDRRLGDLTEPPATWERAADIAHAAYSLVATDAGTPAQPTLTATEAACDGDCAPAIAVQLRLAGKRYAAFTLLLRRSRIVDYVLEQARPIAP